MPLRILLAEDHNLVRAGIRALLQDFPEYKVVAEAATGADALRLIQTEKPDIVLMDIAMPELNGLEVLSRCVKEFPNTRIIILSMYSSEVYVLRALRNGASGYLLKGSFASELDLALKAAARGEIYVSSAVSQYLVEALKRQDDGHIQTIPQKEDPYEQLTSRQRQVLQLIAEGNNTKAIAAKMGISPKTVKTYRAQLMQQLGIHEIAGLVRYAFRVGIVKTE